MPVLIFCDVAIVAKPGEVGDLLGDRRAVGHDGGVVKRAVRNGQGSRD